jgi:hypothetical protein
MEVLWLLSQGETPARAGPLAGVSMATVERYVALFRRRGVPGLREFHGVKPTSALEKHQPDLEPEFRARPPPIEEHNRTQATFLREKLEPVLTHARATRRSVFFVDAAHFVQGRSCAACGAWCGCSSGGRRGDGVQRPRGLEWRYPGVDPGDQRHASVFGHDAGSGDRQTEGEAG